MLENFLLIKKKIFYKEHEDWYFDKKKKIIFIVNYKNYKIGYIRAENKKKPFLSWAIMSKYRGKNFGVILLKKFIRKMKFKSCFAQIDQNNIPSILMVIKNNFKFKYKKKKFLIFESIK